jgi:hypothetical protein
MGQLLDVQRLVLRNRGLLAYALVMGQPEAINANV